METVTLLEFRRHADAIVRRVQRGQRLILTYRGKPVMRLEPIVKRTIGPDDPFYSLGELAAPGGQPITNEEIDKIVYHE